MALPYPQDPASPSAPNPYFQDNNYVRGDQFRAFSAKAWANFTDLDSRLDTAETDISAFKSDVSTLQTDVADLETQVQKTGQPDYRGLLVSNDVTHPTYAVVVAAGQALGLDVGGIFCWPMKLASAMTKNLTSNWAAGTGNGGLDTGSIANNTWYYPWLIMNLNTFAVDVLWSASASSPTMPSGYTIKRRIRGAVLTDGSGSICGMRMSKNGWTWWGNSAASPSTNKTFLDENTANPGTSAVLATLTVPPLEVTARVNARMRTTAAVSGAGYGLLLSPTGVVDEAPANGGTFAGPNGQILSGMDSVTTEANYGVQADIDVDSSRQIRYRCGYSDAALRVQIATVAYLEPLSEAV